MHTSDEAVGAYTVRPRDAACIAFSAQGKAGTRQLVLDARPWVTLKETAGERAHQRLTILIEIGVHPGDLGRGTCQAAVLSREDAGVTVITIAIIGHVADGLGACSVTDGRITEAVTVSIHEEGHKGGGVGELVLQTIAILVLTSAAELRGTGVHVRVRVIAIQRRATRVVVVAVVVHIQAAAVGSAQSGYDHEAAVGLP